MTWLHPGEWEAVGLSLRVAAAATACALPLGILLGRVLARREFRGKGLVETLVALPLVLPPVVTGYLLLVVLGTNGPAGKILAAAGLSVAFTWKGAAVASGVLGFPLMVRAIRLSMESVDPALEQAARTLGAGPLRVFCTVVLPLAVPGILSGALLAFARSLGEFGATITFVGNIPGATRTLPLATYTLLQTPGGEAAAARLAGLSVLVAVAALGVGEWLARRDRRNRGVA
ncbi:MAG: molybdate ABC transporter permease subunit [Gemmatimonadota bacterium]|nr:molybdate ABC transporter permease subunit [Gemmatimonadota bacterium]MDP6529255.1 molybdate ABC transporter permease subunit [Gemmatimonadota bacterium]MDP6802916.1 molybdate ABC transporter permease subunit [Gemmatimonadota bacterium]MDP7031414.1 molybdate ABC transporter permease subunit [Gemmatimonadota bacterium]